MKNIFSTYTISAMNFEVREPLPPNLPEVNKATKWLPLHSALLAILIIQAALAESGREKKNLHKV